jgi:hypothetical protein
VAGAAVVVVVAGAAVVVVVAGAAVVVVVAGAAVVVVVAGAAVVVVVVGAAVVVVATATPSYISPYKIQLSVATFTRVPLLYIPSKNNCEFLLLIVTPDAGTKVVLAEPNSIKLYWYPIGIATEEFSGTVKFIGEDVDKRIVLLTSANSNVKLEFFVITVEIFEMLGSRSNWSVPEFQSIPTPASVDCSTVELSISESTYAFVARRAVFAMP